jgi:hypothetical protein
MLRGYIQREVRAGFGNEEDIIEACIDAHVDEFDEESLRRHVPRITAEEMANLMQEQATWPVTTDCDRLDAALTELERDGIVCRQNFSCCGTCGSTEIWDEINEAEKEGGKPRGYLFYHEQDTESAVEYGSLFFNYGAIQEPREAQVAIGREIERALQRQGFTVDWDGSLEKRIGLTLEWRRRR